MTENVTEPEIQEPKKAGRPSEFSSEVMTEICERMSEGKSLRQICEDPDMPARRTVLRWIKNDDNRRKQYEQARQAQADWYSDEIRDIAWNTSNDTSKGKDGQDLCNHEWIARSRLKVDTLKFLMAKQHPGGWGDKLPETVEDRNLKISWEGEQPRHDRIERIIIKSVDPIHDDDGSVIQADDNAALRRRIATLEERLGMREPDPGPPKLITHDPGPLPKRLTAEVMQRFARAIGKHMPDAEQRSPDAVLDEAISLFEDALEAKYSAATVEF